MSEFRLKARAPMTPSTAAPVSAAIVRPMLEGDRGCSCERRRSVDVLEPSTGVRIVKLLVLPR
jgi:hypothetical protein